MAALKRAVFVRDPVRHRDILLRAGEEPAPEYAALVTNPDAWEDGKVPTAADENSSDSNGDDQTLNAKQEDTRQAAPAAKKPATKKAAASRSRGRDAADEGSSGE